MKTASTLCDVVCFYSALCIESDLGGETEGCKEDANLAVSYRLTDTAFRLCTYQRILRLVRLFTINKVYSRASVRVAKRTKKTVWEDKCGCFGLTRLNGAPLFSDQAGNLVAITVSDYFCMMYLKVISQWSSIDS